MSDSAREQRRRRLLARIAEREACATVPTPEQIAVRYADGWILFGDPGEPGDASAPMAWHRYAKRAVITPDSAKVPRRLRSIENRGELKVRVGDEIDAVIDHTRRGRDGWLTAQVAAAYRSLAPSGRLTTVAAYRDGKLAGGLWGLQLGRTIAIMSMFHLEDHAGALTLAAIAREVGSQGRWTLADCGTLNENFARYGAHEVALERFCELVCA